MKNLMWEKQRDTPPLNDLPGTADLTPELGELVVYFKAFHSRPELKTSSGLDFISIGGNIDVVSSRSRSAAAYFPHQSSDGRQTRRFVLVQIAR
jgi:hypothetical protein